MLLKKINVASKTNKSTSHANSPGRTWANFSSGVKWKSRCGCSDRTICSSPVECLGDAVPSTEDASPVPSGQVQINPVGLTGAYFRGPASPPSSARSHNQAPVHISVHNDRPSTLTIPRGCLLAQYGSEPVVSPHARARRPSRLAHGLSTNTRTARTRATGTHFRQHL